MQGGNSQVQLTRSCKQAKKQLQFQKQGINYDTARERKNGMQIISSQFQRRKRASRGLYKSPQNWRTARQAKQIRIMRQGDGLRQLMKKVKRWISAAQWKKSAKQSNLGAIFERSIEHSKNFSKINSKLDFWTSEGLALVQDEKISADYSESSQGSISQSCLVAQLIFNLQNYRRAPLMNESIKIPEHQIFSYLEFKLEDRVTRPNTEHPEKSDETPILSEENYMELIQLEKNDQPAKFVRIKFLDIETQDFEAIFAVCSLATLRIIGLKRSQNNDRLELLQTHEISNRMDQDFYALAATQMFEHNDTNWLFVACAGHGNIIYISELFQERPRIGLLGHMSSVTDICFQSPFRLLSASADGTIRQWSTMGGNCLRMYQLVDVVSYNVFTCLEKVDSEHFFSGNANGKIYLWKTSQPSDQVKDEEEAGQEGKVLKFYDYEAYGIIHKQPVVAIKTLPEEQTVQYLFSQDERGIVRISIVAEFKHTSEGRIFERKIVAVKDINLNDIMGRTPSSTVPFLLLPQEGRLMIPTHKRSVCFVYYSEHEYEVNSRAKILKDYKLAAIDYKRMSTEQESRYLVYVDTSFNLYFAKYKL